MFGPEAVSQRKLHPKKAKNFEKKILGFKAETNSC
jgi:hypothetical protein